MDGYDLLDFDWEHAALKIQRYRHPVENTS